MPIYLAKNLQNFPWKIDKSANVRCQEVDCQLGPKWVLNEKKDRSGKTRSICVAADEKSSLTDRKSSYFTYEENEINIISYRWFTGIIKALIIDII